MLTLGMTQPLAFVRPAQRIQTVGVIARPRGPYLTCEYLPETGAWSRDCFGYPSAVRRAEARSTVATADDVSPSI
jgi:hypothetical protein